MLMETLSAYVRCARFRFAFHVMAMGLIMQTFTALCR
jgi:hypothetical protein